MNFNKFSKESVTIGFYIIYLLVAGLCFQLFPGDAKKPNIGVLLMFLLIPVSFIYAAAHILRHFNSGKSYFKCLVIHVIAWLSIIGFLTNYTK